MWSDELPQEGVPKPPRLNLRQVPAEILCPLGWLYGTLHVPLDQALPEFLAQAGPSVNLTRVRLPREAEPLSFIALRRASITIVAPALAGSHPTSGRDRSTVSREIACLFGDSILRGTVEVPTGLRLSDFLREGGPYLTVRHGMLAPYGETLHSPAAKSLETAFVNLDHVAGVSEST